MFVVPVGALGSGHLDRAYRKHGECLPIRSCRRGKTWRPGRLRTGLGSSDRHFAMDLAARPTRAGIGLRFGRPCYSHGKFEGLLNNSLISPLTRSLYGTRIQNPMGPDLGISRRLFQRIIGPEQSTKSAANRTHRARRSIAPDAVCGGFKICQAHVGVRIYPPIDWSNLSSAVGASIGTRFFLTSNATPRAGKDRANQFRHLLLASEWLHRKTRERWMSGRMLELFRPGGP